MAQAGIHSMVEMAVRWWVPDHLMMPAEFLFCALFFFLLGAAARRRGTDGGYLRTLGV